MSVFDSRYRLLDAFRGLAALAVVLQHVGVFGDEASTNVGYYAVMVFFVISGYCISAAVEGALDHGSSLGQYLWRRLRRIYPPYFIALCFFAATRAVKLAMGLGNQFSTSPWTWLQNFSLTQWLSLLARPGSFPFENDDLFVTAFWSLNYEEQFYLVAGLLMLLASRLRRPALFGVLVLLVPALGVNALFPTRSFGFFIEFWAHFAIGSLVFYRLCKAGPPRSRRLLELAIAAILLGSAAAWWGHGTGPATQRSAFVELVVVCSFALLLVGLRRWDAPLSRSAVGRALCAFGAITYSLYLTHQFNVGLASRLAAKLVTLGAPAFLAVPIQVAALVAVATVFWFLFERPFLNKALRRPKSAPEPSAVTSAVPQA